ncbi:hypothetical protein H0H93_000869 [Arthromyces matolae]|nr:hypothetical protein H0H93_000869 [Arthromyces matolae]
MGRLIWFHVPLRITPKTSRELETGRSERTEAEMLKVMNDKRMALDLVDGFCVALKHHIRGEMGMSYKDLYHLIRPLHAVSGSQRNQHEDTADRREAITASDSSSEDEPINTVPGSSRPSQTGRPPSTYGTFKVSGRRKRTDSQDSNVSWLTLSSKSIPSAPSTDYPDSLSPSDSPYSTAPAKNFISNYFHWAVSELKTTSASDSPYSTAPAKNFISNYFHWAVSESKTTSVESQNLPLEVLGCLSNWLSFLEDKNTVPETSMGQMIAAVVALEKSLTALERILTTPLPFVYSVHIRFDISFRMDVFDSLLTSASGSHTVWIYLFLLPFQLVDQFGYYTILGVAIAAFIYLGFLAVGEAIEQPFGYRHVRPFPIHLASLLTFLIQNDLDLDLFCRDIIHTDMARLKTTPCLNAYFGYSPLQGNFPDHRSGDD